MNKTITTIALALALLVPAALLADDRGGSVEDRVAFLTGYLGLTDSQKAQATTIFTAATTASETLRGQMTAARDALTAAVKANASDSALDRLAAAVGVIAGQEAAVHAKANAKFYALLTADQKTKYDALGDRAGGPRGGGGRP